MNVAKLKEQARRHEQSQEWKKALDVYVLILSEEVEDEDLPLYNRAGDLCMRLGNTPQAIDYYETAVDRYAAAGLHNNAIALCKKILRTVPGRTSLYLRLGRICAGQGFVTDARQNFLEYAERTQQDGDLDEAFRALMEFADLVSGEVDVRLLLASQLETHGRAEEAARQLLEVYRARMLNGDQSEAQALAERIHALDPDLALTVPERGARSEERERGIEGLPGLEPTALVTEEAPVEAALKPGDVQIESSALDQEQPVEGELALADVEAIQESAEELEPLPTLDVSDSEADEELPMLAALADGGDESAGVDLPLIQPDDVEVGRDVLEVLRARVAQTPDDYDAWVKLGEELLERGAREEGVEALNRAHRGFADTNDLDSALRVMRELLRMSPDDLHLYQKLVEYAFRKNTKGDLIPAYLGMAECLERTGEETKAKAVYQRVLELDPGNEAAEAALRSADQAAASAAQEVKREEYVDLGALILDEEVELTTRFVVGEEEPSGDEEADFQRMLSQFKSKVSEHVDAEDYAAHYDLGVAFKEMGLLDEAIAEFQQALRGTSEPLKTYELLGQCFLEKGMASVAAKTLSRALALPTSREVEKLAVYYYLGRAHEELGDSDPAREFYEKVLGLDIGFRDVSERLRALR